MDPWKHERLHRRVAVAEEMDQTIDQLAKLYGELTTINSVIAGNRRFDKVETDRRFINRLTFVLAEAVDPEHHQGPLGVGRPIGEIPIADLVRRDHADLAAKKGA